MFVSEILKQKGATCWHIGPQSMVYDALQMMAQRNVGALLVMTGEHLEGIVSERDYARKIILLGRSSRDTRVADIMTRELICVTRHTKVAACMNLMTTNRIRHLPVLEEKEVVGLVSIGDVVKHIIAEQEHLIHDYEQYIRGDLKPHTAD